MNTLSHWSVSEEFLGFREIIIITYTIRERTNVLKGKLESYSRFHKQKPSNHDELLAFLGLLTISMGFKNKSRHESLLEYQTSVQEAHQFFGTIFTEDRRLLLLHSMLQFRQNEVHARLF